MLLRRHNDRRQEKPLVEKPVAKPKKEKVEKPKTAKNRRGEAAWH